tara:strand:+ start:1086 stop:1337 length:252 start_codon:yes stop_codon:yes gene_type:complete
MATLLKADGSSTSNVQVETLEQQQELVGGYIEYVRIPSSPQRMLIVNEEGRLQDSPEINDAASMLAEQTIVGDAVLVLQSELN